MKIILQKATTLPFILFIIFLLKRQNSEESQKNAQLSFFILFLHLPTPIYGSCALKKMKRSRKKLTYIFIYTEKISLSQKYKDYSTNFFTLNRFIIIYNYPKLLLITFKILMINQHLDQLKEITKVFKRPKTFERRFSNILTFGAGRAKQTEQKLIKKLESKFPLLKLERQDISFNRLQFSHTSVQDPDENSHINQASNDIIQSDEEDSFEIKFRQFKDNDIPEPIPQTPAEIDRIITAIESITVNNQSMKFFDQIHEQYKMLGGGKTKQQLQKKLQLDVLYLVKRQNQKKKK